MFRYAQLSAGNIVVGISELAGEVNADNMILINDMEVELGYIYDPSTQTFTAPEPQPEPFPEPSIEERILAETQYQTMLLELTT